MEKTRILIATLAISAMALISSCSSKTDPIHGTIPVDTTFYSGSSEETRFPLEEFHRLGEQNDTTGQRVLVDEHRKALTANVKSHYPMITDERNIRFILGSGFAKNVESGDGKLYSGEFRNELIIVINDPAISDTVFLACGNGMLSPLELTSESDFGHAEQWRFTIQRGEGLAHHVPELEKWGSIAKELQIPIKDKDGNVVGNEIFMNYLGKYESVLFIGDVIDLLEGKVFNQKGQEVDFERRMLETKKANEEAAKQKKARVEIKRNKRR